MSRVFSALQEAQRRAGQGAKAVWESDSQIQDVQSAHKPRGSECGDAGTLVLNPSEEDRLLSWTDPQAVGGESFRLLVSRLNYLSRTRQLRSILVTSSIMGEGKSLISANLAIALANHGAQRTLLIDADHRHSTVTRLFKCLGKPGLREWLSVGGSVAPFAQRVSSRTLWFVPTGMHGPAPERSVQDDRVSNLIAGTDGWFDWVVVDSSPATVLADTTVWSGVLDGCLLVARAGATPKKMLEKAIKALNPSKLVGVVLNDCADPSHSYYGQYYRAKQDEK